MNFHDGVVAIFATALRRRFPNPESHDIACFVRKLANFYAPWTDRLWPLETEMLIRHGLGERVPLDGMDVPESEISLVVAVSVVADLGLTIEELDDLIADAEKLTAERGFPLTPVGDALPGA